MDAPSVQRRLIVNTTYLHLPVENGAPKVRMGFRVDGGLVREFELELATGTPSFHVFADVSAFHGREMIIEAALPEERKHALEHIVASDVVPDSGALYSEPLRPQFHFTSRRGWLNDPNGLVYHGGLWHLYYQHNPYGWKWGNMHWGHAVSPDLLHWRERPIALYPRRFGDWAYSGSAAIDVQNTSGFGQPGAPPLVLAYTSTGRGECIAFSLDGGATWLEYEGNPVVTHDGRDPRLLWDARRNRWVMAVFQILDRDRAVRNSGRKHIAFYTSPDLKTWTFRSRIEGYHECPDLFELPVDGDPSNTRWVLYGADARYQLGDFDGSVYTPDGPKQQLWYGHFYAAQTYSNAPDNRRVQIGWAHKIAFPDMPFNQQMALPVELSLRSTAAGPRLCAQPVTETRRLRCRSRCRRDISLSAGVNPLADTDADVFELALEADVSQTRSLRLILHGAAIAWDAAAGELTCGELKAPVPPVAGRLKLQAFADRASLELFIQDGAVAVSAPLPLPRVSGCELSAEGPTRLVSLDTHALEPVWGAHP